MVFFTKLGNPVSCCYFIPDDVGQGSSEGGETRPFKCPHHVQKQLHIKVVDIEEAARILAIVTSWG